jgi:hypothetical protein
MNADEIVGALRICSRPKGHRCSECPIFSRYEHRTCKATVDKAAADLIESLQAQLAKYDEVAAEYGIDGQTMLTLAKSQIATAADNVKLMEQLTASQRREKAARNELCQKCGRYHEAHKGACDGCRWKGESNA